MNLPFTKNSPTAPGHFVWRWDAGCPERLLKIYLHHGLLLTDNAEHPNLMGGEWCELVAKNVVAKISQRQLEEILINEGVIQAASIEDPSGYDGGKTELSMTIVTRWLNDLFAPSKNVVQSGNENEVQTRKAASSHDLPVEPRID